MSSSDIDRLAAGNFFLILLAFCGADKRDREMKLCSECFNRTVGRLVSAFAIQFGHSICLTKIREAFIE